MDEAIEGPYEAQAIKFIEGFGPELLVSPDDPDNPEIWMKAGEVDELKALQESFPPTSKPANSQEPREIPGLETIEEVWVPDDGSVNFSQRDLENVPGPLVKEETVEFQSKLEPAASREQISPPEEETVSSLALLEVMEKLSEFKKEERQSQDQLKPSPMKIKEISWNLQQNLEKEKKSVFEGITPVKAPSKNIRILLFISLGIVALMAGTFLGSKKGTLRNLKEWLKLKVSANQETRVESQSPQEVQRDLSDLKKKTPKPKPKSEVLVARKTKTPPVTAKKEEELKSQKFLLPGVLSPNIKSAKSSADTSLTDKTTAESTAEELSNSEPPKGAKKNLKDSDWQNQAGWGQ